MLKNITVFRNIGHLLSLAPAARKEGRNITERDLGVGAKAAFAVQKGKVIWIGAEKKLPLAMKREKSVDLQGRTVVPGFVECHTHSVFAGDRSQEFEQRLAGATYQQIAKRGGGIQSTVKNTRQAEEEELVVSAQRIADNFLAQGVTTLEIKSGYGLNLKTELKILRVARRLRKIGVVTTYLGAHSVPKEAGSAKKYMTNLIANDLSKVAASGLTHRADIFIESGFFDLDQGRSYLQKAKELGLELVIHADQLSRTGASRLGAQMGARSVDHLVQINKADQKFLAQSQTTCVLLPGADFYLQMKYPPARQLLDMGARVALATDFNPGSCPSQNIGWIGLLARTEMAMSLPEVICAYTLGAAYALGLQDEIGSLEEGKRADFAVLDGDWRQLFYSVGHNPITSTWRNGKKSFGSI